MSWIFFIDDVYHEFRGSKGGIVKLNNQELTFAIKHTEGIYHDRITGIEIIRIIHY